MLIQLHRSSPSTLLEFGPAAPPMSKPISPVPVLSFRRAIG
jgi:hypothetical protein